jgi:hypothetical protein
VPAEEVDTGDQSVYLPAAQGPTYDTQAEEFDGAIDDNGKFDFISDDQVSDHPASARKSDSEF